MDLNNMIFIKKIRMNKGRKFFKPTDIYLIKITKFRILDQGKGGRKYLH